MKPTGQPAEEVRTGGFTNVRTTFFWQEQRDWCVLRQKGGVGDVQEDEHHSSVAVELLDLQTISALAKPRAKRITGHLRTILF